MSDSRTWAELLHALSIRANSGPSWASMSDLRDRIAAAIREADMMWSTDTDPYIEAADAVIAALGLRRESYQPQSGMDEMGVTYRTEGRHRYVTEWQADE